MCWITKCNKHMEEKIAKRNINTWKIVSIKSDTDGNITFKPRYYDYKTTYCLNQQYNTSIHIKDVEDWYMIIDYGIHSYSKHAINDRRIVTQYEKGLAIMECIIPRGTKYYINEYGEYVSESIIPKSFYYTK